MAISLSLALLLAPSALAHNWLQCNSRASRASTIVPCPQRLHAWPHVQVGANQDFLVEWAASHHRPHYFVILHQEDENKLKHITNEDFLEQYLNEAPIVNGQLEGNHMHDNLFVYGRRHVSSGWDGWWEEHGQAPTFMYDRVLEKDDPWYIARPRVWDLPGTAKFYRDLVFFKYKDIDLADDTMASYTNPNMPWIESVYKYGQGLHLPRDTDMANIKIPARKGPGRYIVHYLWTGYRDCIDVNVLNHQSNDLYGTKANEWHMNKIDHAVFTEWRYFGKGHTFDCTLVQTGQECLDRCKEMENCSAFQIHPLFKPNGTLDFLDVTPSSSYACNPLDFPEAKQDDLVCYAVKAGVDKTRAETGEMWLVEHDTQSPVWYSTAYWGVKNITFADPSCGPACDDGIFENTANPWRFGDKCISCDHWRTKYNELAPKWELADECELCSDDFTVSA